MPQKNPTQQEIAKHLFISSRRVRELQADGILPAEVGSLDEARRMVLEWLRERASGRSPKTHELETARSESLRLDIDRKRLELAELQGDLVRLSVCEDEWRDMCLNIRTRLLTLPNKCAGLVSPDIAPVVQEVIKRGVHEALRELAHNAGTAAQAPAGDSRRTKKKRRTPRGRR